GNRLHDLSGLAVAALWNLLLDPCLLDHVQRMGPQSFDSGDVALVQVANTCLAGAHRLSIDMNGAGTALCNATAVLRPRDPQLVAQYPQQRHVGSDIDLPRVSIYR